jgi:hypothetical protein
MWLPMFGRRHARAAWEGLVVWIVDMRGCVRASVHAPVGASLASVSGDVACEGVDKVVYL